MEPLFADRRDAGAQLAEMLDAYRGRNTVVVGLARGGVAVGAAVAEALPAQLVALVIRKIGAPFNEELAIGAISETGQQWIDREAVAAMHIDERYLRAAVQRGRAEAQHRRALYAGSGPGLSAVAGSIAIVVDDGIATGATAMVALQSVRALGAATVVLATPVASVQAINVLRPAADEIVAIAVPAHFGAVGLFYGNFNQVSDDEVRRYLRDAAS